jgi:hypothetical protein
MLSTGVTSCPRERAREMGGGEWPRVALHGQYETTRT